MGWGFGRGSVRARVASMPLWPPNLSDSFSFAWIKHHVHVYIHMHIHTYIRTQYNVFYEYWYLLNIIFIEHVYLQNMFVYRSCLFTKHRCWIKHCVLCYVLRVTCSCLHVICCHQNTSIGKKLVSRVRVRAWDRSGKGCIPAYLTAQTRPVPSQSTNITFS